YYAMLVVPPIVALLMVYVPGRRYGSPERYEKHLVKVDKQRDELLNNGYLVRTAPGKFSYTPAYHASRRSSSSSSSSSSSGSSSSGGGRSGGGGSSSRW
ncbi:MAG: TPM domain-containing protein, partial [Panacagrimonas sp.]